MLRRRPVARLLLAALLLGAPAAGADEGMWPLNRFPFALFEREWKFRPSGDLLERLRGAVVRLPVFGGSAAFVSSQGLLLTNQHVVEACLMELSSPGRDLVRDGYVARTRADELACPGAEALLLESITPVTSRVRAAAAGLGIAAAAAAIKAEMAAIEQECARAGGGRCEVVSLYQGGEYDLYRYRRYTDLRLVFAPEARFARFGGDQDNFDYPRFALDAALLRVYENGRVLHPPRHLRLSQRGAAAGDLLFLAGYPGSTARHATVAQLEWQRDVAYPALLLSLGHLRSSLAEYAARGGEARRYAEDDLAVVENSVKAISGYLAGLLDPALIASRRVEESELRAAVASDPELAARVGDPWREIEIALDAYRTLYPRVLTVERGLGSAGQLAWFARTLVRLATERERPSGERLREYREAVLPTLLARLTADLPSDLDYEAFRLGHALREAATQLGPFDPVVRRALGDRPPEQVAREAVAASRLGDAAFRRALVERGRAAIETSDDPLLRLMWVWEPLARDLRDRIEREVDAVDKSAGARLADAFFARHGRDAYPDANSTLRVSFGPLAGYATEAGPVAPFTRFEGLFARARARGERPPFDLPPALAAARARVEPDTPLDFVVELDLSGGSSGGPLVDRRGELVGVLFDGNLWTLPNRFRYSGERARGIAVDSRALLEALTAVYPAGHLARELLAAPGR